MTLASAWPFRSLKIGSESYEHRLTTRLHVNDSDRTWCLHWRSIPHWHRSDSGVHTSCLRFATRSYIPIRQIHLDTVWNDSVDLDTMFGFDYLSESPFALGGEAGEVTCDVVKVVAKHTPIPYDSYHGIRVSQSDKSQYASKIVFLISSGTNLRQVCDEVAEVVFGHGVPFASNLHDSDRQSDKERESMRAYSCLDFNY